MPVKRTLSVAAVRRSTRLFLFLLELFKS